MSAGTWFRAKSLECERLADEAKSEERRAECLHQATLWLQIADNTDAFEQQQLHAALLRPNGGL